MHRLRILVISTLTSILIAGCASHTSVPNSVANPVVPQVVQTGNSPTNWVSFSTGLPPGDIITGPDNQIWFTAQNSSVYRFDISTSTIKNIPLGFQAAQLGSGPDGNVWVCGFSAIVAKVTPKGAVTTYPAPQCQSPTSLSGNIWVLSTQPCSVNQITPAGVVTQYLMPSCSIVLGSMAVGSDGNLWFVEVTIDNKTHSIVRFDLTSHTFTQFDLPSGRSLFGLKLGSDGNLYSCRGLNDGFSVMNRISMTGAMRTFSISTGCSWVSNSGPATKVYYFGQIIQGFASMDVGSHKVTSYGEPPNGDTLNYDFTFGSDMNIWGMAEGSLDVFVKRILSVVPSSATISVGQTAPFSVSETNCNCVWSATSSNPLVASVSSVSGGQFTVTGIASGSATVTVADHKQNVFPVSVTVP